MKVLEVLGPNLVLLNLNKRTKKQVITSMAEVLYSEKIITNINEYIKSVMQREEHSTTGVGNGIAIPHGKSSVVTKSAISFVKLENPIEWDSLDNKPVTIVVMLAIPDADKGATHLSLLSEIAVKLMDDELVDKLKEVTTANQVIKLLS